MELKLRAFLGAALVARGSLADGATNIQNLNDAESCVDPSVEDAKTGWGQ